MIETSAKKVSPLGKLAGITAGLALVMGATLAPGLSVQANQSEGTSVSDESFVEFSFQGTESEVEAARHCGGKWVPGVWTPACINFWPGGPPVPRTCSRHWVVVCK